jgi:hypothetical protein
MSYRDEPLLDDGSLSESQRITPTWPRLIAAFVLAPAIASVAFAFVAPGYDGLPYYEAVFSSAKLYALLGAYPLAFIFGIPLYLGLRKNARATALNCAVAGALIAATPWFFVGAFGQTGNVWTGNRATLVNGELTTYGWIELGQFLLLIGAAGAAGGVVLWLVAAFGVKPKASPEAT